MTNQVTAVQAVYDAVLDGMISADGEPGSQAVLGHSPLALHQAPDRGASSEFSQPVSFGASNRTQDAGSISTKVGDFYGGFVFLQCVGPQLHRTWLSWLSWLSGVSASSSPGGALRAYSSAFQPDQIR